MNLLTNVMWFGVVEVSVVQNTALLFCMNDKLIFGRGMCCVLLNGIFASNYTQYFGGIYFPVRYVG